MKTLLFIISFTLVANAHATIPICKYWHPEDGSSIYFANLKTSNQYECADNQIQPFERLYLKGEIDNINNKLNADLNTISKSNESLKKRMFDVEQALAQDVVIPDSQIEKIKNDLRAELKDELKKEIMDELKNNK